MSEVVQPDRGPVGGEDAKDRQVQAVLAEYSATRAEIVSTVDRQTNVLAAYMVALGAAYGFMASGEKTHWDLLPFLALLTAGFVWIYATQDRLVVLLSLYVYREIEERKIPALVGRIVLPLPDAHASDRSAEASGNPSETSDSRSALPIGWQHFYQQWHPRSRLRRYRLLWHVVLFLVLGMLPAGMYCLGLVGNLFVRDLPPWLQGSLWQTLGRFPSALTAAGILATGTCAAVDLYSTFRAPGKRFVEGLWRKSSPPE